MKPSEEIDKVFYRKLVRDGILRKIELRGSRYEARKLSKEEFESELFKKLLEEARELVGNKNKE